MKYLKNASKSFCFQFVPAIIIGMITIYLLIVNVIPYWYLFFTFIMWILSCGLGIAVGYHRVFSHKTHELPRWKENIILFFATFSGQGGSIFWVALHRGYHHPYTDTEKDIHSPVVYGIYQSFVGWYNKITESKNIINIKYAGDLIRKSNHVWFHKNHLKILWGVPLLISLIDWKFSLTAFCLVTFIGSLQDNLVNVFGHQKNFMSYRNFDTKDNSHNNLLLGYFAWGQGWHNNHHYDPKSFDFGKSISKKWWEWDPCNLFLKFLK